MELQGRELKKGDRGVDVGLLHSELVKLGFEIPGIERVQKWFGDETQEAVCAFQGRHGLEATGIVDEETATRINQEVDSLEEVRGVTGRVTQPDGIPLAELTVKAFDRDLRQEALLGEATTDQDGHYSIAYTADQLVRPDKAEADLLVRVYDPEGEELAVSPVRFNAQTVETIDLVLPLDVYRGPSEYERLLASVTPVLKEVSLAELTEEDISFVAGDTGQNRQHLGLLAASARLAEEQEQALSAELVYACARQGLPAELPELARRGSDAVLRAVEAAIDVNQVSEEVREPLADDLEKLTELAIDLNLEGENTPGALLRTSHRLSEDQRRAFVRMSLKHPGPPTAIWERLKEHPEFVHHPESVAEVRFALDLGTLVQDHVPLVAAVQEQHEAGAVGEIRDLADWEVGDWEQLISGQGTGAPPDIQGATDAEREKNYAKAICKAIEAAYPTAVVRAQLSRIQDPAPGTDVLLEFLDQNPDFELGTSRIDDYIEEGIEEHRLEHLYTWDRLAKISPAYGRAGAMEGLKKAGFDSALSITRVGHSSFVEANSEVLRGQASVEEIWKKAIFIAGGSLNIFTEYSEPSLAAAIPQPDMDEYQGLPNWKDIFGSLNFCECKHCKSVYGPAAYFVDLLSFLDNASKKEGQSPLDVLLSRRPDLAHIELSCENTNTLLPYVDLVLEVLEHATAPLCFHLPPLALAVLIAGDLGELATMFAEAGFPLSKNWELTEVEAGVSWRVTDGSDRYDIVYAEGTIRVYPIGKQTSAKQKEISAYPEHLNEGAYIELKNAVYPWTLPFNLWDREARLYLEHLGFKRYLWMDKFKDRLPELSAIDVACEHLRITSSEQALITGTCEGSDEDREKVLWGLDEGAELNEALRLVRRFMEQAGIGQGTAEGGFTTVQQLLATRYINPNPESKRIRITYQGDPCDLDQAWFKYGGTASETFCRIRRFLRLQRKLGWSIYDLDRAIAALKANLDDKFLVQISHIAQLQGELKAPLAEMLAWWSPIDTMSYDIKGKDRYDGESLYQHLFLDRSLEPASESVFELDDSTGELVQADQSIIDNAAAVSGALEIDAADLAVLIGTLEEASDGVPPRLTLENLSHLYRIVSLAKALGLSVGELLAAAALTGIEPFDGTNTDRTLRFCDMVRKVRASEFDFADLDYLLRHQGAEASDLGPASTEIWQLLAQVRAGLHRVEEEMASIPDPAGKPIRERLALVLPPTDAETVISSLGGHSAELEAMPEGIEFPETVAHRLSYVERQKELRFAGIITHDERELLLGVSTDEDYQRAIEEIFEGPRTLIDEVLCNLPALQQGLAHLLTQSDLSLEYVFGAILNMLGRTLRENLVKQQLSTALGLDPEVMALLLQTLVDSRQDQDETAIEDWLALSTRGLDAWYWNPDLLRPWLRPVLERTIAFDWTQDKLPVSSNHMAAEWKGVLQADSSESHDFRIQADGKARLWIDEQLLIDAWQDSGEPVDATGNIDLKAGKLYAIKVGYETENPESGSIRLSWRTSTVSEETVPGERLIPDSIVTACRDSYILLHKLAMLISRFGIEADELRYLSEHSSDFEDFDVNRFPIKPSAVDTDLFHQWEHLHELCTFRDRYPRRDHQLIDVLDAAHHSEDAANEELVALTGWDAAELDLLAGEEGLALSAEDWRSGRRFIQLHEAFYLTRRLGISTEQLCRWSTADSSNLEGVKKLARELRQTVRAKYGRERWLKVAQPLRDELREGQRAALVAYLVHQNGLEDANDLYAHFLVDVEMDPCMLTSRIKQAISAVQLFVQRCLMNLEPAVSLTPGKAAEWEWRKNYRVWEANRKVFLYPENWVEPELRDDKSPFFQELENELLQGEITDDAVETVYRHYLEKLDGVARLEIMGMYHQVETEADINVLHVFGRTRGEPHTYYYRRWVDESYWTPWERVDLDIEGDHLIPVVWNRRLYLFWPIFKEKTVKFDFDEEDSEYWDTKLYLWEDNLVNYWDIQLASSECKNGKWSARKTSEAELECLYVPDWKSATQPRTFRKVTPISSQDLVSTYVLCPDEGNEVDDIFCAARNDLLDYTEYWESKSMRPLAVSDILFAMGALQLDGEALTLRCYLEGYESKEMWPIGEFRCLAHDGSIDLVDDPGLLEPSLTIDPYLTKNSASQYEIYLRHMKLEGLGAFPVGIWLDDPAIVELLTVPGKLPVYWALVPHQNLSALYYFFFRSSPFCLEDQQRTLLVTYVGDIQEDGNFRFQPLYHPLAYKMTEQLSKSGVAGLLNPGPSSEWSSLRYKDISYFDSYQPTARVGKPYPVENVDFSYGGAYSLYNWELFFHIPLLIADRLAQNQRFEEAIKWFHYIFNPLDALTFGLQGTYFRGTELGSEAFSRIDSTIDFDWTIGSPDPRIEPDRFSVRWTGKLLPPSDGEYTFTTETDDGVRLWIDGNLLINEWRAQAVTSYSRSISLKGGRPYDLKMEYYENGDKAVAKLKWQGPDMPETIIPHDRLYTRMSLWKLRAFTEVDAHNPVRKLMKLLAHPDRDDFADDLQQALGELEKQIDQWQKDPFKPHLIARLRLAAYMKTVVMKYIDALIAWGDQLFRQDSIESINEATQLYILAAEILGQRPEILPALERRDYTYGELKPKLDEFSNALVRIENWLPEFSGNGDSVAPDPQEQPDLMLYFGVPHNDKLLGYWDMVEDPLFKIRHCMTIEGRVRQLPLFQPPIDPGLLVRAAAAGVDLGSVLRDLNAPLPHYRFQVILQKAVELCGEVRSLGAALLSALEKRDAEELALLRSTHEIKLLKAARGNRKGQIDEAEERLASLNRALELTQLRYDYYKEIEKISPGEKTHRDLLAASAMIQFLGQELEMAGSSAHGAPDYVVGGLTGMAGGAITVVAEGGSHVGAALQAFGRALSMYAAWLNTTSTLSSITAGYSRRWDEWKLQERLAGKELEQIEKQIAAAEIRLAIAERELENHDLQIENAQAVDTFMRDKFTNRELYNWMVSQISAIYFQSYQMAYDLAKRAERAFQYELGLSDATFVEFGYWDSLKKGLLAGERLGYDLKRMEVAYLDQNRREYELTKHVSLAVLDPFALVQLKHSGTCEVKLPEWLFDLDYPGHYMRRIKSVGLTVPCITGPYTSVSCTLTLLSSSVRTKPDPRGEYTRAEEGDDDRFQDMVGAIQSIATSSGQSDSGLFELNFRDERYLPFEGAGALSTWRLELPQDFPQFDYDTVSDVVMHLRYTAREGGDTLKKGAVGSLKKTLAPDGEGLQRLFSLRHEFPTEWHHFLRDDPDYELELKIGVEHFPFVTHGREISIQEVGLFLHAKPKLEPSGGPAFTLGNAAFDSGAYEQKGDLLYQSQRCDAQLNADAPQITWTLKMSKADIPDDLRVKKGGVLDPDKLENVALLCHYTLNKPIEA